MWKNAPVHIIDFEGSNQTGVLEYGVVTLKDGDITYFNTRLCKAKGTIPIEETRQHAITNKEVQNTESFDIEWEHFNKLRKSGPFCAHNAIVENHFLKNTWPYPNAVPNFLDPQKPASPNWGPYIDTYRIAQQILPKLKSHKLGDLVQHFNLQADLQALADQCCPTNRSKAHCALYDCLACALVLLALAKDFALEKLFLLSASSAAKAQDNQQLKLID